MTTDLLRAENLSKSYPVGQGIQNKGKRILAVNQVFLAVQTGETLGLVGESGCGKSTLGKLLVGLESASKGKIFYENKQIWTKRTPNFELRQKIQMIFQDPFSSLNPRQKIKNIIAEGLLVRSKKKKLRQNISEQVSRIMHKTGLLAEYGNRYPHEFSGGQRQRIAIARVLAMNPSVVICDEPVSALDVSIQAQIVNLLRQMQEEMRISMLFISHDLSVISNICHSVAVMYLGSILETGRRAAIYSRPAHPYTQALLKAVPSADPEKKTEYLLLQGEPPSPLNPPGGCPFHTRCPQCMPQCREKKPGWTEVTPKHYVRCFLHEKI
ncbi:MAG: ABC transporter ATP-binding protein [Thermodesulfobacteriota bacterium]